MKRWNLAAAWVCLASGIASAQGPALSGDAALYKQHAWFELKDRIAAGKVTDPLFLGATAAAFGEEEKAHLYLDRSLKGKDAAEAHGWLSYIEMRRGHYRAAAAHIVAANGDKRDALAATFRDLPDQVTVANSPSTVRCRIFQRKLFLPVSVDGQSVELILDSDSNLSFLSETAAKLLGLTVRHSSATIAGARGNASRLSITTADVTIGNTRIKNVAFMVLPDKATLFATLAPRQQGALGIPVMIALERASWRRDGNFVIGQGYDPALPASSLAFDGADPIVRFSFRKEALTGVFDTGAETTTLWTPFATRFAGLLKREGKPGAKLIRGFGGDGMVPETVLRKLDIALGGITVQASPAHVVTGKTTPNSEWLDGRMGLDLYRQAKRFTFDFRAYKLQLER